MALPPTTTAQGNGERVKSTTTATSTTTPLTRLAPYKHALASQIASAISTTAFYPFDVIKMRFMSHDGTPQRIHNGRQYTHVWRSIGLVLREEGVRQLFRGAHVAVTGAVVAWGVYMLLYKELQRIAATLQQQQPEQQLEAGDASAGASSSSSSSSSVLLGGLLLTVGSSAVASAIANTLSCPIFLIKARMQLEEQQKGTSRAAGAAAAAAADQRTLHYATFRQGFRHVTATTGVLSLWRGLSAQLLLGLPNCLNLPIYEYLSHLRRAMRPAELRDKPLDLLDVCAITTTSKTILTVTSHPIFVVKTRLQDQRSHLGDVVYKTFSQTTATVMRREGVKGFYRGLVPALTQAIPRAISQFVCYEYCLRTFW